LLGLGTISGHVSAGPGHCEVKALVTSRQQQPDFKKAKQQESTLLLGISPKIFPNISDFLLIFIYLHLKGWKQKKADVENT